MVMVTLEEQLGQILALLGENSKVINELKSSMLGENSKVFNELKSSMMEMRILDRGTHLEAGSRQPRP
jgi:hypothetical protein